MTVDNDGKPGASASDQAGGADNAAARALAEAQARRKAAQTSELPKEEGGRKGPEPTRYGDWEKGGIASDF